MRQRVGDPLHGRGTITARSIRRHLGNNGLVKHRPLRLPADIPLPDLPGGIKRVRHYHPTKGWKVA